MGKHVHPHRTFFCLLLTALFFAGALSAQSIVRSTKSQADKNLTVAQDGSGDFTTIQEAIDRADYNARIRIKEGTYYENLTLKGFVNLEGAGIGKTVVMADPSAPAVMALNLGSGRLSRMSFQFRDSSDFPVLMARYASFVINSCAFRNGRHGIDVAYHSSITIRESAVVKNTEAGIRISGKCQGLISGSTLAFNGSDGIIVEDRSSPVIEKNTIRFNGRHGISIFDHSMPKVAGNYIYGNHAGIVIRKESSPIVRNNTILLHTPGVGILIYDGSAMALINNNIVFNETGIRQLKSGRQNMFRSNNLWANSVNYDRLQPQPGDLSVDPRFMDIARYDLRIDSTSDLYEKGADRLSIGADYDYAKSDSRLRIDYLKNQAMRELGRENWYLAYQAAQEILTLDKDNAEGRNMQTKASQKLSMGYVERAQTEFENDNLRVAENFIRMALSYDLENQEARVLQARIQEASRSQQFRFMAILGLSVTAVLLAGYFVRKRIQFSEKRRQARWWLDDAEEHVELARGADSEHHAQESFAEAVRLLAAAKTFMVKNDFDSVEHLCNEITRHANRAKDEADKYKQIRKDALLEVSNAEILMRQLQDTELATQFSEEIHEFGFYLERAQTALVNKQYVLAKEVAEDIQNTVRVLQERLNADKQQVVRDLIRQTEEVIIDALSSNSSADIIIAVIDFKSDLEVLKSGFENGQLTTEEAGPQIRQIYDFIKEALQLGTSEGGTVATGRKRNYYEILGIKEDASVEQIKAVFRKLSMIYHPDMNTDDELGIAGDERFREIKEAYEALMEEKTRA